MHNQITTKPKGYDVPAEWAYQSVKGIFKFLLHLTYNVKTYGTENLSNIDKNQGFILAANHGSIVDAFVMGLEINSHRVRFVGRQRTLWSNPIFGKINDFIGTIPVPERKEKNKNSVINTAVTALKEGACVGIFPEGAILNRRKRFDGKTGIARMALNAEVPVVPVGLFGTDGLWPYGAKMPRLGRPVIMKIGTPISFEEYYSDKENFEIIRLVTDKIMKKIRLLTGWYQVPNEQIIDLYNHYTQLGI